MTVAGRASPERERESEDLLAQLIGPGPGTPGPSYAASQLNRMDEMLTIIFF